MVAIGREAADAFWPQMGTFSAQDQSAACTSALDDAHLGTNLGGQFQFPLKSLPSSQCVFSARPGLTDFDR
jgi:hypothetical protein